MESSEKISSNHVVEEPVINYRGIKAMPYIIGNETFEKLGTVGSNTNLVVYLTTVMNMKSVAATTLINVFNGTAALATLIGAFLADTYFGRYNALGFSSVASVLGMLVLTLTAAIPGMHPPECVGAEMSKCNGLSGWQFAILLLAFGLLVAGAGGIRPCNLAFGADQFNPNTESGKRGTTSFFNWYFFTYTFAVMVAVTGIVYVQSDVSWAIGLAIPAILMLVSCVLFFWGTSIYVIVKPHGSPLTSIAQVLAAATRKRRLKLPQNPDQLFNFVPIKAFNSRLMHTNQFQFLDKAAIITETDEITKDGLTANPWKLCSIQQVEEVKCLTRILPIWTTAIIFHIGLIQQQTYAILQALQMDRHLGHTRFQVPAATFIIFIMATLTIWIPIYDQIIAPLIRRVTKREGGFTPLQRMGIGVVICIFCMIVSGVVEQQRRLSASTSNSVTPNGRVISSMSSMWLIPQLALAGLAEGFNYIAQFEFYYKEFPENMRSISTSVFFAGTAVSNYLSGFLVTIVHQTTSSRRGNGGWLAEDLNKGKLDLFYYMIGGLGFINFGYFLVCANWYKYKGVDGNSLVEMRREGEEVEKQIGAP